MNIEVTLKQALDVAKQGGPSCPMCPASLKCQVDDRPYCKQVVAACFKTLTGEMSEKERRVNFFKKAAKVAIGQ